MCAFSERNVDKQAVSGQRSAGCQGCSYPERCEELQRTLEMARDETLRIYNQAASVMSRRSGVPRGLWSFWRGAGEMARRIYSLLNGA